MNALTTTTDRDPLVTAHGASAVYDLTAIKEAGGEETPRFEAKITKNGLAIATVSNDGNGGCNRYYFDDRAEEAPFEAWIAANHPAKFEASDAWVYRCLDFHAAVKQVTRAAKKKTLFRLATDEAGAYRTIGVLGAQGVEWVRRKYPGASVFDPASKQWFVVR